MNQTWHILGAGAIGSLLAAKLQAAGQQSCLLYRPDHGFSLDCVPPHSIERLVITTKAHQALAAWQQAQGYLSQDAIVILMHNGMGVAEQIQQLDPLAALYLGTTTEAAHFNAAGELIHAGVGETRIGGGGHQHAPPWFAALASSEERFIWEADIEASLWRKLLINCAINPLTAINNCNNGVLASDPELRRQALEVCEELIAITVARGYRQLAQEVTSLVFDVIQATADNQSSMLLDVRGQRVSENEYINGYLTREAKRLDVPCPANRLLFEKMRAIDDTNSGALQ
jgi:2-dehydropantoate 2-reductase